MKNIILSLFAIVFLASFTPVQDTIYVHWKAGNITKLPIAAIDSLNFSYDYSNVNPNPNQTFKQDSVFKRIYSTLSLTGTQMPAGNPDINGMDEALTSFFRCIWNLNELTTDEAICSWGDPYIPDLNSSNYSSTNEQIKAIFLRLYFNIGICNYFLENTATKTDEISMKQRAEARFVRALNYYYLLDLFGNVPLLISTTTTNPTQISRAELFTWLENELITIQPNMYAAKQAPYSRADVVANWLLLSRLYLNAEVYIGSPRWNDAAIYSKKVMDSGYTLSPSYKQLFMADNAGVIDGSSVNTASQEIILPIVADGVSATTWGSATFLIASTHSFDMTPWGSNQGWSGNRARASLIHKFYPTTVDASDLSNLTTGVQGSTKDARALFSGLNRTLNITSVSNFSQGYSIIKFSNIRADGQPAKDAGFVDMDIPLFRLAEANLNYAEAILRGAATISGYSALSAINALRVRAGATLLLTADLQIVLDEKAREFFFEGQRRTDLIRFNKFGGENDYKWDWKGGNIDGISFPIHRNLFPIPQSVIESNVNLFQNVGY